MGRGPGLWVVGGDYRAKTGLLTTLDAHGNDRTVPLIDHTKQAIVQFFSVSAVGMSTVSVMGMLWARA